MGYLEDYSKRMGFIDNDARDRKVKMAREKVIRTFNSDPASFKIEALEPGASEKTWKRVRVLNEGVIKQLNPERVYSKYFIGHPDEEILSGSIFYNIDGKDYLITAVTNLGGIHDQGMGEKINARARFKFDKYTISLPIVALSVTRLEDGIEKMELINLAENTVRVRIQSTDITKQIKRNHRVEIGGKFYTLGRIDNLTDENILNWVLTEDLSEATDDNMFTPPSTDNWIVGADKIHRGKDYIYLSERPVQEWTLESATDVVTLKTQTSTSATLRVEKTVLIGFKLIARFMDGEIEEKEIRVVSLL